jgi:hypothetical protein
VVGKVQEHVGGLLLATFNIEACGNDVFGFAALDEFVLDRQLKMRLKMRW